MSCACPSSSSSSSRDRSLELRNKSQPAPPTRLPFEEFLTAPRDGEGETLRTTPSVRKPTRNSYAEAARNHKRTLADRVGVSPLDISTKRSALFTSPPPKYTLLQTPADQTLVSDTHSPMETSTPENDRPLRSSAQRRLFGSGKENIAHPNRLRTQCLIL